MYFLLFEKCSLDFAIQLWPPPSRSGSIKMLLCEGHVLMIYYVDQTLPYALT